MHQSTQKQLPTFVFESIRLESGLGILSHGGTICTGCVCRYGVALQSDSEIPSRRDVDIFLRLFEQLEKISAFPTFPLEDIDNVTLTFKRTVTISIVPRAGAFIYLRCGTCHSAARRNRAETRTRLRL